MYSTFANFSHWSWLHSRLSGVEDSLAEIVEKEGKTVNEFKGLLKQNKSIQEEMAVCFFVSTGISICSLSM
jgi:hypothetical protein